MYAYGNGKRRSGPTLELLPAWVLLSGTKWPLFSAGVTSRVVACLLSASRATVDGVRPRQSWAGGTPAGLRRAIRGVSTHTARPIASGLRDLPGLRGGAG